MEAIKHEIKHIKQHDEMSCGSAAIAMLLSFFDDDVSSEEISKDIPTLLDDNEKEWGSNAVDEMLWCMRRGYKARGYVFDSQIMNQTWAGKDSKSIVHGLESLKGEKVHPLLGKKLTESFISSYVDFLNAGGELTILPSPTRSLLYELLKKGPYLAAVNYNTLYRTDTGFMTIHASVVRGNEENGTLLLADPWEEDWEQSVEPDHFMGAIMAAQMSCENAIFQISK
jgi:hypothetical protein